MKDQGLAAPPTATLECVCVKCTRHAVYVDADLNRCVYAARKDGWVLRNGKYICKRCPK